MAGKHDFTTRRGETFSRGLRWTINETDAVTGVVTKTPVDLTNSRVTFTVRKAYGAPTAVIDLDNATKGGVVLTNAADGRFTVTVTDTAMASVPVGKWVYSIRCDFGTTTVDPLAGKFVVEPEVAV